MTCPNGHSSFFSDLEKHLAVSIYKSLRDYVDNTTYKRENTNK